MTAGFCATTEAAQSPQLQWPLMSESGPSLNVNLIASGRAAPAASVGDIMLLRRHIMEKTGPLP